MAQVTVKINGYAYTVGCQDGEEDHLLAMAADIERRIDSIKAVAGQTGEARMLVMAALLMADDLFEMRGSLAEAEKKAGIAASGEAKEPDPKLARKLARMARRAEDIAAGMEHP